MIGKVVIVGKPNVGKSQLFNRLSGERHSIVVDERGITRDRVTLKVDWLNQSFLLTDTGGYTEDEISFQNEINRQTEIALRESDVVIFVVSYKDGIDNDDIYLSKILKKKKIDNIILVANKFDCDREEELDEYKLGFGDAIKISAEHGINTGVLLKEIIKRLQILKKVDCDLKKNEEQDDRLKICIIGRPNVGKSSFVNSLLGENRVITSDVAGTTRDAIDLDLEFLGKSYKLIDTPGIKRHATIKWDEKEKYSLLRAKKAIARSQMVFFMLDISEEISELDERVGGLLYKANIPTIIIANKWDLIKNKSDIERKSLEKNIRDRFKFLHWAPITFISSKYSQKLDSVFSQIESIKEEISKTIEDCLLNNFLHKVSSLFSVPKVKGKRIHLISISKIKGQIPTFLVICNNPEYLHFSYSRMLENQIRSAFGYKKTPITVIYKKNFL